MRISLELELVDSATDPTISAATTAFPTPFTNWSIVNVQARCDLCTLDNALDNSYTEHLISEKSFPIRLQRLCIKNTNYCRTDCTICKSCTSFN
jgi:hypothetical protein